MSILGGYFKPLFSRLSPIVLMVRGVKSQVGYIWPDQPFLLKPSLIFSPSAIKRNWDVLPIICFTVGGFTIEMLYTLRQSLTRDDVRYNKLMACEYIDDAWRDRPPKRKCLIFNQKYEWPEGLLDHYDLLDENKEPKECDKKDKECLRHQKQYEDFKKKKREEAEKIEKAKQKEIERIEKEQEKERLKAEKEAEKERVKNEKEAEKLAKEAEKAKEQAQK